jgi:dihydrofolate reductase
MTNSTRKLIYYVAGTLDGYIADANDGWSAFPMQGDHAEEYIQTLQTEFDTVVMGRRTYEIGLPHGVTNPYPFLKSYVLSQSLAQSPDAAVTLVRSDASEFLRELKRQPGKSIYLCGGGTLAKALIETELVDELWLKLNPVLLGAGKALSPGLTRAAKLEVEAVKRYRSGVILLRYRFA